VRTRRLKNSTPQAAGAELIPGQGDHDTTHHEIILLRSDKVKVERKQFSIFGIYNGES